MIAFNLGMNKIMFQSTIGEKQSFILELPSNEHFLDFLQFNRLRDLNFHSGKMNVNACSYFMFITEKKNKLVINLMLVDPYLKNQGFMLFQSPHGFDRSFDKNNRDPLIKDEIKNSIIYSTKGISGAQDLDKDIRVLIQF